MTDWRSIPLRRVDWNRCGVSRRAAHAIHWMCRSLRGQQPPENPESLKMGAWGGMTLGELADRGERWWWRCGYLVGPKGQEVIRRTIDMAAAGDCVTLTGASSDAYVPKSERGVE